MFRVSKIALGEQHNHSRKLVISKALVGLALHLRTCQHTTPQVIDFHSSCFKASRDPCTPLATYGMPPKKILSIETLSQPAGRVMLPVNHSLWFLAVPVRLAFPVVEMPSIEYSVESKEPACVIYLLHHKLIKRKRYGQMLMIIFRNIGTEETVALEG